jgi:glutamate N-acetyltransferase/amino-acid N-acetyltransferase
LCNAAEAEHEVLVRPGGRPAGCSPANAREARAAGAGRAGEIRTGFPLVNSSESGLFVAADRHRGKPVMAKGARAVGKARKKLPCAQRARQKAAPAKPVRTARSPLAPKTIANLPPLAGVRLATGAAGVRYKDRTDVLLAVMAPGTQVAGVFTKSKTSGARSNGAEAQLKRRTARALVVNSGNANAFTGKAGRRVRGEVAESAAAHPSAAARGFSGLDRRHRRAAAGRTRITHSGIAWRSRCGRGWRGAAEAIMTTDTYPKIATARPRSTVTRSRSTASPKGSGMIAPDMATMLAFVFTDAALPAPVLQDMLSGRREDSFNAITVDSDTSTSDTLLLFATGKGAHHPTIAKASDKRLADFRRKLDEVLLDLALQVVRDGEGAQKLIRST